jgi:hypothetical protein
MYVLLFLNSSPVSIISFYGILYENRKCKICQTVSLFLFCMGANFHELLYLKGRIMKLRVLRNRVLRRIRARTRVVMEDGENYISRNVIIYTRNELFGQKNGVELGKVCSTH